jgi:hypothetical protein
MVIYSNIKNRIEGSATDLQFRAIGEESKFRGGQKTPIFSNIVF